MVKYGSFRGSQGSSSLHMPIDCFRCCWVELPPWWTSHCRRFSTRVMVLENDPCKQQPLNSFETLPSLRCDPALQLRKRIALRVPHFPWMIQLDEMINPTNGFKNSPGERELKTTLKPQNATNLFPGAGTDLHYLFNGSSHSTSELTIAQQQLRPHTSKINAQCSLLFVLTKTQWNEFKEIVHPKD